MLDDLPARQSMPAPGGADIDVGVDPAALGDLRARPETGQQFAARFGDVPSEIHRNLRPRLESLDIFPREVRSDHADLWYWLADIQRKVLAGMGKSGRFRSLVWCSSAPIPAAGKRKDGSIYSTKMPGKVELHAYPGAESGAEYGFYGLKRCGNAMMCFTCAPKVHRKRRDEVRQAVEKGIGEGMSIMMVTMTAPHYRDTDPRRQVDKFKEAQRLFREGRWWQEQKAKIGFHGCIRALEVTMPDPRDEAAKRAGNGAHVHTHELDFCARAPLTDDEARALRERWLWRWRACLLAVGIEIRDEEAFRRHGLDIALPRARGRTYAAHGVETAAQSGERVTIDDADAIMAMAEYVADRAGAEISPGIFTKAGRKSKKNANRISHLEYFALALVQCPEEREYMLKLMTALKGRAWMYWTRGLKAWAGIEDKTDEELMVEEGGTLVRQYDAKREWAPISRHKLQRRYIRAMVDQVGPMTEDNAGQVVAVADRLVRVIQAGCDPLTSELLSADAIRKRAVAEGKRPPESIPLEDLLDVQAAEEAERQRQDRAEFGRFLGYMAQQWRASAPKTPAGAGVSGVADGRPIGAGLSGRASGVAASCGHNPGGGRAGCRYPAVSPPVAASSRPRGSGLAMLRLPGLLVDPGV